MNKSMQTLKGFRDFLPEEALKRKWLENKIRQVFELWGYDPLETPTLEPLELFQGQIGEDEKLFFKFKDSGGRNVALRYDQTVPVCRVVSQYGNNLPMPFKRYQIQPAFRAEKPQKGRYREFIQADADIFGVKSPVADAEVIALSLDIFRNIGFKDIKVLVNDRKLLKNLPYGAIVSIDKLKKIGTENVAKEMEKRNISAENAKKYLSYVKNLQPNSTIKTIFKYLAGYGINKDWYEFDPTIARSFAYSTGPIWEIEISGFASGSVLGGERFDKMVKDFSGSDIPGTGFGLGFDRTLEAAEQFSLIPIKTSVTSALVTVFDQTLLENSLNTARELRKKMVNTDLFSDPDKKIDKQLKYANKKNIPYVIVIGPDEAKENKLMLKNMKTGTQKLVSIDEAVKIIKNQ